MNNSEIERFTNLLSRWGAEIARLSQLDNYYQPDDFHEDEAVGFLRAFDAGIVNVSDTGYCTFPSLNRSRTMPTKANLFSKKTGRFCWREYITQIGVVASLVLEYEWPQELVGLDPGEWAFDVAGYSSISTDATMIMVGEAKKTAKELTSLRKQLLDACNSRLTLAQLPSRSDTAGYKNLPDGHKKYLGLINERPQYLWLVAPGARWSFQVKYEAGSARIEEIEDLPAFSSLFSEREL